MRRVRQCPPKETEETNQTNEEEKKRCSTKSGEGDSEKRALVRRSPREAGHDAGGGVVTLVAAAVSVTEHVIWAYR